MFFQIYDPYGGAVGLLRVAKYPAQFNGKLGETVRSIAQESWELYQSLDNDFDFWSTLVENLSFLRIKAERVMFEDICLND